MRALDETPLLELIDKIIKDMSNMETRNVGRLVDQDKGQKRVQGGQLQSQSCTRLVPNAHSSTRQGSE